MAGHKRTPLTPQQVGAIKVMVGNKKSNRDIATSPGLKKITVAYAAATVRRSGKPAQKETRGRPKLLSERQLRGLPRVVQDNPFASMAEISETVNAERAKNAGGPASRPVSVKTLRRAVKGLGLASCAPAKEPFVSDVNKEKRLKWGKQHDSWTYHWDFVFLSDESSFLVRQPQARRVWRQSGERYSSVNLRPTFKSGRESDMVLGGFSSMGRTPLFRMEGSMNAQSYPQLLETQVFHYLCADFGSPDGAWFQEDLAPCHTAKKCKVAKHALGLKVLPWVGKIPDLNPTENAWAELERRLRARPTAPKTKDDLFAALQDEWAAIPGARLRPWWRACPVVRARSWRHAVPASSIDAFLAVPVDDVI